MDGLLDNFDPLVLLLAMGGTALAVWGAAHGENCAAGRLLLVGSGLGLLIFNGIGAADREVGLEYLVYYFGFLLAFLAAYRWFTESFRPLGRRVEAVLDRSLARIDCGALWRWVTPGYLLLLLIPLMYPQWRLGALWAPGGPDLAGHFESRFQEGPVDSVSKWVDYGQLLLLPFFYLALYRYRRRMTVVAALLGVGAYLDYVAASYLGRSTMVVTLGVLAIALWLERPRWRRRMAVVAVAALPLLLVLAYVWEVARLGGSITRVEMGEAAAVVAAGQTGFPARGMVLIESGERADLTNYLTWIATLPLPKALTGTVAGARINYEIAEVVLGVPAGRPGFHVTLTGVVAESVYLYGRDFFWLHGLALGMVAGLLMRLLERPGGLLFLRGYVMMTVMYSLTRGGVAAALPTLVNHLLGFYLLVAALMWNRDRMRTGKDRPGR